MTALLPVLFPIALVALLASIWMQADAQRELEQARRELIASRRELAWVQRQLAQAQQERDEAQAAADCRPQIRVLYGLDAKGKFANLMQDEWSKN